MHQFRDGFAENSEKVDYLHASEVLRRNLSCPSKVRPGTIDALFQDEYLSTINSEKTSGESHGLAAHGCGCPWLCREKECI